MTNLTNLLQERERRRKSSAGITDTDSRGTFQAIYVGDVPLSCGVLTGALGVNHECVLMRIWCRLMYAYSSSY